MRTTQTACNIEKRLARRLLCMLTTIRIIRLCLALAVVLFLLAPAPASSTLIAITLNGDLYHIDPATGTENFVGSSGQIVNNLAHDPQSGTLYAQSSQGLVTLDPMTGAATVIGGTNRGLTALAYGPDGSLYGIRNPFSDDPGGVNGPDVLVRIDPLTGIQTDVGSLGGPFLNAVQGIAFLGDTLYGWDLRATAGLLTIDTVTGQGIDLPAGTPFQDVQGLGASADETFLWGIGRGFGAGLMRIDPDGTQTALYPPSGRDYRGIEDLGILIPEPSTWALLMVALAGLGVRCQVPGEGCRGSGVS